MSKWNCLFCRTDMGGVTGIGNFIWVCPKCDSYHLAYGMEGWQCIVYWNGFIGPGVTGPRPPHSR